MDNSWPTIKAGFIERIRLKATTDRAVVELVEGQNVDFFCYTEVYPVAAIEAGNRKTEFEIAIRATEYSITLLVSQIVEYGYGAEILRTASTGNSYCEYLILEYTIRVSW